MKLSYGFTRPLPIPLKDFVVDWLPQIDCEPIGQRLEVDNGTSKREGIIGAILDGIDIGLITIGESPENTFKYESIDGGHRKRYIRDYMGNEFKVRGKYYSELSDEERENFKNYEIVLTVYGPLNVFEKGYIFRNLNKTTDVNKQEHRNSFGDIPIANLIRYQVRNVRGINNQTHELFELTQSGNFKNLSFDNSRLKIEQYLAYFCYRLFQKETLGSGSQKELTEFYERDFTSKEIKKLTNDLENLLDFLFKCSLSNKKLNGRGLSQRDFKILSFLYFHMLDNVKLFTVKDGDYENLIKTYVSSDKIVQDKLELIDVDFDEGRTIGEAYKNYHGGYTDSTDDKVKQTIIWLLEEFDIDKVFLSLDTKRSYTYEEKKRKLIEQDYKCYITGKGVRYEDCEAAHIDAHAKGGKSSYDNFVMCLKEHNEAMGTMNLHDYMKTIK